MSNAKAAYSEVSRFYCNVLVPANSEIEKAYVRSKIREQNHNEKWIREKVNIVDIVNQYAPDAKIYQDGVKLKFEGNQNIVICDMASGYLRIQNKATKKHYRLDGTLTSSNKRTHFKIKRKEEM